ncbi:glycosyltransferase family 39 protein [Oleiagrimonas sp. C23AA]|uniref:ArnT family glycosyltransferase n=1 Tax=Oleiagrimonas sp. C23AA TaxID=2719047 RepID=UPI00141E5FAC|nr:glycosyltransferase family 39 protein [Oleiagrimonas sp. C23AA]NII10024.1 glycosyltransferase family 39 protein [Oleiagrimonas sp. C23AA]
MFRALTDDTAARRALYWFMLIALVVLAAGLGLRGPWPPDEPRFALVAQQMVDSGHWLFPHRGIELYADKPPMLMWLEAVSFELVRSWRIAFLLPSLVAGMGTLALVYDLGRRLWSPRVGLVAAALLLCALQFTSEVKQAQIDPLEMFWITLGNWGLLVHLLRGPHWGAFWLGCFAAGLGVITKGVGVLVLLMLLPYGLARWRGWRGVAVMMRGSWWRWALGALAFLLAIALWLGPMLWVAYHSGQPDYRAYVNDILFHQTADRYAHSWAHAEPVWFFAQVMLTEWFPLSLLALACVPLWRQAVREREPRVLLPLLWWALVLVFFSIPLGKRSVYVLPVLPMVALALAPYAQQLMARRWLQRLCMGLLVAAAVIYIAGGAYAWLVYPKAARRLAASYDLAAQGKLLWWIVMAVGVSLAATALAMRRRGGIVALLAGMLVARVVWVMGTYPLLDANQSTRAIMQSAFQAIGPQGQLALVGWREELLFQAHQLHHPVAEFGFTRAPAAQLSDALRWQAKAPHTRWVLIETHALGACIDTGKTRLIGTANRTTWWLFDRDAVKPACRNARAPERASAH